jgi:hypothetical protein
MSLIMDPAKHCKIFPRSSYAQLVWTPYYKQPNFQTQEAQIRKKEELKRKKGRERGRKECRNEEK